MYFTQVHEDAILEYCKSESKARREELYGTLIQPAFDELVDKIVYTYKFTSLENIDVLKDDCKVWLTTILSKFDPTQGTKAFSYFSVVTKNWFTHKAKKQTQKNKREIEFDSMIREIETLNHKENKDVWEEEEERQFWTLLLTEVESWRKMSLKENEQKVLTAVLTLMEQIDQIEIFNKKAIYLYLRELTGMNTKQIVSSLNKMRARYKTFKKKWDSGEIH